MRATPGFPGLTCRNGAEQFGAIAGKPECQGSTPIVGIISRVAIAAVAAIALKTLVALVAVVTLLAIVRSITVTPIIASVSVGRGQPGAIVVSMNSHFLLMNSQLSLAFRMSSDRAEERDQSDIHRAARIHPKCN